MCQNGKEEDRLKTKTGAAAAEAKTCPGFGESVDLTYCKYCREKISKLARVCRYCQKPQTLWKAPPLELAGPLGIAIALGLLILGALQYRDAKGERIDAAEALKKATAASGQAVAASRRALAAEQALDEQRAEININTQKMFSALCVVGGGKFNYSTAFCQLPDGRELKYDPMFQKSSSLPVK